ncbi:MAG TPA: prenyltransferase/squalene oxidase repeat-containing protein [Tepidisphaeraceae bacterium]|nr:prenyltransferase/squalene oxidase repeat-containing protein [Tepidisphaeraceae bacterium]
MKRVHPALLGALIGLTGIGGPVLLADPPAQAAAQASAVNTPVAQANATISKALVWLKSQQKPGTAGDLAFTWQDKSDPPALSAIVLKAFMDDNTGKYDPDDHWLDAAFDKLLSYQKPDGSISLDVLPVYNTAIAISALADSREAEYKDHIDKAVAYLKSVQWGDTIQGVPSVVQKVGPDDANYGGWGYGKTGRADGSNEQVALDALHDAGLKADDPSFKAALKFVTRLQNDSETNDMKWAGNDGGFIYYPSGDGASAAGSYTGADGKHDLRSYGSMTYAGLKSMIYAGLTKDDPRVKAAMAWISKNWTLDENPGMQYADPSNPKSARSGLFYYYHTLARALRAFGEPVITDAEGNKHDWRVELIAKIASQQQPDGSFVGTQKWMEDKPVLATAFAVLALEQARDDLKDHPVK